MKVKFYPPSQLPTQMFGGLVVNARATNKRKAAPTEMDGPQIVRNGPPFVYEIPVKEIGIPTVVEPHGSAVSEVLETFYLPHIVCAVTSSQLGLLSIERFVDRYGLILHGHPITSPLTANESNVIDNDDGMAFGSFRVRIFNQTSAPALLSGFILLLLAG